MKIISKVNCPRCEQIKAYLKEKNIPYEEEMAEDKGYVYWRDLVTEKTGMLGFPILIKDEDIINGSSEEIISKIEEWNKPTEEHTYFWGR